MLHTYLTTSWHLRYPIIGAPMAYVGRGRLAHAVSQAGGLGMIGIGSTESVDFLAREAAIARGTDQLRFGIGMHAWAIEKRPDLLEAAIEANPFSHLPFVWFPRSLCGEAASARHCACHASQHTN